MENEPQGNAIGALHSTHSRHHLERGVFNPSCTLCVAQHPELVPVGRCEFTLNVDGTAVPKAPVKEPKPAFENAAKAFAAIRASVAEAATAFNMTEEQFGSEIFNVFGMNWERLCEVQNANNRLRLLSVVQTKAAEGDLKALELLSRMSGNNVFEEAVQPGADLSAVSDEDLNSELAKRVARMRAATKHMESVIERKGIFDLEPGQTEKQISPTLKLTTGDSTPGSRSPTGCTCAVCKSVNPDVKAWLLTQEAERASKEAYEAEKAATGPTESVKFLQ